MNRKFISLCSVAALLGNSVAALAQNPVLDKPREEKRVMVVQGGQIVKDDVIGTAPAIPAVGIAMAEGMGGGMGFQMNFENKLVKGKPYSADIVQENTQTLGDGNRIVQRSNSFVARDSEGRTRQEISIGFGPLAGAMGKAPKVISINDPVSGNNYMLHADEKTAIKIPSIRIMSRKINGGGETSRVEMRAPESGAMRISGGVLQGNAINKVSPKYPVEAKAAGVSGTVNVSVTVDENGQVTRAEAVNGPTELREAAVQAARQWQFKPTELAGKAVKTQGALTFNFTLADTVKKEGIERTITINRADGGAGVPAAGNVEHNVMIRKIEGSAPGEMRMEWTGDRMEITNNAKYESKQEELGSQMIEGVNCTGTRSITTIPAGAVNNELPINIVSESWYSSELETTVLRKFNDPRYGENVYRLTNISRSEPAKDLFEIPADYSLKEDGPFRTFQYSNGEGQNMKFEMRTDQKIITKEQQ